MQSNLIRPYISEAYIAKSFGYNESVDEVTGKKCLLLEGEFQRAEADNRNTRVYTYTLLKRETDKLRSIIEERGGHPMEMDHPIPDDSNSKSSLIRMQRVDMNNACALTVMLEMQGNIVYGKAKTIEGDFGTGDKLTAFVRAGYKPGVSSRGMGGDPVYSGGSVYVPEDYNMICYDAVTNPSVHNAVLQRAFQEEVYMLQQATKYKRNAWEVLIDLKQKYGVK